MDTIAHFVLRIPKVTLEQARALAAADARSINWFICHAVEDAIRHARHNQAIRSTVRILSVDSDVDIIKQHRDSKGRFVKRSANQE